MTISVFLLDDYEVVRKGLRTLLETQTDIRVVGEAGSVAEALVRIPVLRPDVAILDVRLPDGDGITVCREIRSVLDPAPACLMLASFSDDTELFGAIMAGAAGCLPEEVSGDDLVSAVRSVAAGGRLLDPHVTALVFDRLRSGATGAVDGRYAALTPQERRVLELVADGLTNRQIAQRLCLAEKTVKNYMSTLLHTLGLRRRTQAAMYYAALTPSQRQRHRARRLDR